MASDPHSSNQSPILTDTEGRVDYGDLQNRFCFDCLRTVVQHVKAGPSLNVTPNRCFFKIRIEPNGEGTSRYPGYWGSRRLLANSLSESGQFPHYKVVLAHGKKCLISAITHEPGNCPVRQNRLLRCELKEFLESL